MSLAMPRGLLAPLLRPLRRLLEPLPACTRGGWRWWLVPPFDPARLDALQLDPEGLSERGAIPVKANPVRQVWRLVLEPHPAAPAPAAFIKISRPWRPRERFKQAVIGSPNAREFLHLLYAARHDVPAVRPLALAERGPASVLVTAALDDAEPLSEAWLAAAGPGRREHREALALAVADTLARAHQAGLGPRDLHPGNLLITAAAPESDGPGRPAPRPGRPAFRCHLVDLYRATIGGPISDRQVVAGLVELNQWFRRHAERTDRLRFVQLYLRQRDLFGRAGPCARNLGLDLHDLVCGVQTRAAAQAERVAGERDTRIFGDGRYFARFAFPDGRRAVAFLRTKHPTAQPASQLTFEAAQWRQALADRTELWSGHAPRHAFAVGPQHLEVRRGELLAAPMVGSGPLRRRQRLHRGRWLSGQRAAWVARWHAIHRGQPGPWPLLLLESPAAPAVVWLADEPPV